MVQEKDERTLLRVSRRWSDVTMASVSLSGPADLVSLVLSGAAQPGRQGRRSVTMCGTPCKKSIYKCLRLTCA